VVVQEKDWGSKAAQERAVLVVQIEDQAKRKEA
jgi:hypothetical protein